MNSLPQTDPVRDGARALLDGVLADRPCFHRGETELQRPLDPRESLLPASMADRIAADDPAHYGVSGDVAAFFFDTVRPGWRTLEIGLGVSTVAIALKGAEHVCVTPAAHEIAAIRSYCGERGIDLGRVTFVAESSDSYLPGCEHEDLDLVMIDGKHAFPFPIIDWFFTAERLKVGGIMVIDDAEMKSVSILKDFMDADTRWEAVRIGSAKSYAYEKTADTIHDVAWHMQPYVLNGMPRHAFTKPSLARRAARKLRRVLAG